MRVNSFTLTAALLEYLTDQKGLVGQGHDDYTPRLARGLNGIASAMVR